MKGSRPKGQQARISIVCEQAILLFAQSQQGDRFPYTKSAFPFISGGLAAGGDKVIDKFKLFEGSFALTRVGECRAEFQAELDFFDGIRDCFKESRHHGSALVAQKPD